MVNVPLLSSVHFRLSPFAPQVPLSMIVAALTGVTDKRVHNIAKTKIKHKILFIIYLQYDKNIIARLRAIVKKFVLNYNYFIDWTVIE